MNSKFQKKSLILQFGLEEHVNLLLSSLKEQEELLEREDLENSPDLDNLLDSTPSTLLLNKQLPRYLPIIFSNINLCKNDSEPVLVKGFSNLYIGSIGAAYSLESLKKHGITHILNLSGSVRNKFPSNFKYLKLKVIDKIYYNITYDFIECFKFIDSALNHTYEVEEEIHESSEILQEIDIDNNNSNNEHNNNSNNNNELNSSISIKRKVHKQGKILIHCYQGISRSSCVIIAYMMMTQRFNLHDCINRLKESRPQAKPNNGFLLCLSKFEKLINSVWNSEANFKHVENNSNDISHFIKLLYQELERIREEGLSKQAEIENLNNNSSDKNINDNENTSFESNWNEVITN